MYRLLIALLALSLLAGCKVKITVPEDGRMVSESGAYTCSAGKVCVIEVNDIFFDETFTAVPDQGYKFVRWKKVDRGFFGGSTDSTVGLFTSGFVGNDALLGILESDQEFYLEPVFALAGGDGDAGVCFNEDLAAEGTRVIASYRSQPGSYIVDFDHKVGGKTTFNGESVRQMISDIISINPAATSQTTLFFSTNLAKKRSTNHGVITKNLSPASGSITVKFIPGMLQRYDLAVDESYSQEFDVVAEIEVPGMPGVSFPTRSTLKRTTTYRGVETIEVPAGTFQVCRFETENEVVAGDYEAEAFEIIWLGVSSGVMIQEDVGGPLLVLVSGTINDRKLGD